MRKSTLLACSVVMALSSTGWGQGPTGKSVTGHSLPGHVSFTPKTAVERGLEKTVVCADTIRYADAKEQVLGVGNYVYMDVWNSDNEAFSQTFLLSGSSLSISGVEIQAANNYGLDPSGTATVTAQASIYNVDASNNPTTSLGNGTVTISSGTFGLYYVNFATPITVSNNYAVVIEVANANGILSVLANDDAPGQVYDENLPRFKSDYYPSSGGNYVSIMTLSANGADFEPLVAPIVSYTINTSFTVAQDPSCLGTAVAYTNTSTPSSVLSNRMYSFQYFMDYFNQATSDSTFVWDMDNGTEIWSSSHTYTYPAAGTYDPMLITIGGFWNTCIDFVSDNVTVNPIPAAPSITPGGPTTFCQGGSVTLTSSAGSGNTWSNSATGNAITVSTAGTYTVTATSSGCTSPASAPVTVTVNPLDNASFSYASGTLCTGGSNETPTVATPGGTFSSSAGLALNASTGEIDMTTSTDGSYIVNYMTAGTCPNSSTFTVTITAAPDASFTYAQTAYCSADTDPAPVFGAGASAGTFSSTAGLTINASGQIDVSASTAGTYTVTNTIAASGACSAATETFDVTINETPTATVSGGGQLCGAGTIPVTVTLTGAGPWDITYSDGTNTMNVAAQATSPYTINAAVSGTYTVTSVSMDGCSAAGTGSASVVFNANPTVTFGALSPVCSNGADIVLTATPSGGVYSSPSGGITGSTFDPSAVTPGTITIDYDYTDANGCTGSASQTVVVNVAPAATLAALDEVCVYDPAFALSGGAPAGGTFSGTGVSGGNFDPATAGLGTHVITYSVTDANNCTGTATQNIDVDECLGINEQEVANLLIVPNPANDFITVSYTGTLAVTEIAITTADGKIVSSQAVSGAIIQEKMDVSTLAEGMYFVRLLTAKGLITQKVIVH